MSEKCPNCGADDCAAERNNIVATIDEITICRLRTKLSASEAEVAKSKADHQSTFNKMKRQQENIAGLNATVVRLGKDVLAEAELHQQARVAQLRAEEEVARLRLEVEDVRKLLAELADSPGAKYCDKWTVAARRAAVEHLKAKESGK